jgi:uncharacterized membrane protein
LKKSKHGFQQIKRNFFTFSLNGLFTGIFIVLFFSALRMGPVAAVSSLVSIHILVTVLLAGTLFKEKNLLQRFIAALVMTIGVILLSTV